MDIQKFNINVNGDDPKQNDYLWCWEKLGGRPNRLVIHTFYKASDFNSFLDNEKATYHNTITEIIPAKNDYIINEKILVELTESFFISYTHYDKLTAESLVGEINFFYTEDSEKINKVLNSLEEIEISADSDEPESKLNSVLLTPNGLELDPINPINADYENIDLYFNDDTMKRVQKIIKTLKKPNKGLTVLHGERGTGKTTLVNHILNSLDKTAIFIPCSMIETTINNSDFRSLIKRYNNAVVIIDDSELYFSEMYSKSNIFTNNLLQFIDGFQSDELGLNIIVVLNVSDIEEIDHILLDCNNLVDIIEVGNLTKEKAQELSKHLNLKNKIKNNMKLIDILKKRVTKQSSTEIGFK